MEHVAKTQKQGKQVKLMSEAGWLLKSKVTGKTYKEIDTCDVRRWEVIEDKAAVAQQRTQPDPLSTTTAKVDAEPSVILPNIGKPKTTKRTNRKGK